MDHGNIVFVNKNDQINKAETAKIWDLSITKNVFSLFFSSILLILIFTKISRRYQQKSQSPPKGIQSFIEPIIIFIRDDIAKSAIGEKEHKKFLPFLLTVFFFIFLNNLLGLVPFFPGGANLTGNIAVPMVLAEFPKFLDCLSRLQINIKKKLKR